MSAVKIPILSLPHGNNLDLPAYASEGAAGLDLVAALEFELVLEPGARALIPTGISIALPHGFEAQVRPRSGLALRKGVTVLNSPGTVDSDYRGEVGIVLVNFGEKPFTIRRGDRIAQLVIAQYATVSWCQTDELPPSYRGAGGFGSTDT